MTRGRLILLWALVAAASVATTFAFQQADITLSGHVVDATTHAPIAGATVTASQDFHVPRRTTTDRDGAFVLTAVPAGVVSLGAGKVNYVGGGYGQRSPTDGMLSLAIGAGATPTNVDLPLWKNAAVTGSIVDDRGEPLTGVQVIGIRVGDIEPRFEASEVAITDDRGVYRLSGVRPGRYVIALPSVPRRGAAETGVPTTFYPFSSSMATATVLTLAPGETRERIDLRAQARPGVSVSGVATGLDQGGAHGGGANSTPLVMLHLIPADAPGTPADCDMLRVVSARDGRFTFSKVPPGRYLIRATDSPAVGAAPPSVPGSNVTIQGPWTSLPVRPARPSVPALWSEDVVVVGSKDLENVNVSLHVGTHISGRLVFEGGDATPLMMSSFVNVRPADGRDFGMTMPVPRADASGEFQTPGLPAGPYRLVPVVNAQGSSTWPAWVVRSVSAGGRDLGGDPIALGAADVSDVTITITARAAVISGIVRDANGGVSARASVYIFSTNKRTWPQPEWAVPQAIHEARTDSGGAYHADAVVPGEYFVVSVATGRPDVWRQPAFLESISTGARTITVSEGEHPTIDLVVRPSK